MLSPARLSLKIPESPIEKQAFRSRSFRRFVLLACVFSLIITTVHNINFKDELHRKLATDHFNFRNAGHSYNPISRLQELAAEQVLGGKKEEKTKGNRLPVKELIKQLPEVDRIPFEEAVKDVELQGWEDDWFSTATYNHGKFGNLEEPRIDFVYNCKCYAKLKIWSRN
jgi:hypothetical protein